MLHLEFELRYHYSVTKIKGRMTLRLLKLVILFFCSISIPLIAQATPRPDTFIKHEIIPYFTADQIVILGAQLTDTEGITAARCYFKTDLDNNYLYVPMDYLTENNFQCFLPAFRSGLQTLEYFFLIVNGSGQVIRSTPYVITEADRNTTTDELTAAVSSDVLDVYSELGDSEIENTSICDNRISLMPTQHSHQLHGLRAGIYKQTVIPDSFNAMPGYFGGFILNPTDNTIQPTKGFAPNMKGLLIQSGPSMDALSQDTDIEDTSAQPVNITGDDWVGYYTRTDTSYILYLAASISQEGSRVEITTTKSGLGHYFSGNINAYGDMLVYDSFDGEDWTTHYGPARSTKIKIYDFAWSFEADEPVPPLNKIILYRPPLQPTGVTASDGTYKDKVAVNWNLSDGAGAYDVYGCSSTSTDSCNLLAHIFTNQYDDTKETKDKIYYRIQACDYICSEFSNYDPGYLAHLSIAPVLHLLL